METGNTKKSMKTFLTAVGFAVATSTVLFLTANEVVGEAIKAKEQPSKTTFSLSQTEVKTLSDTGRVEVKFKGLEGDKATKVEVTTLPPSHKKSIVVDAYGGTQLAKGEAVKGTYRNKNSKTTKTVTLKVKEDNQ